MNSFNMIDDCLAIVFDLLPLEDLLHCNLVCHQWNRLYRAACARRRKLTLVIGNPENKTPYHFVSNASFSSHPFANWDDKLSPIRHSWLMRLHGKLDHRLVTGLMHNLANITTLEIILTEIPFEALNRVTELLHFWAEKLVSLKLWLHFRARPLGSALTYSMDRRLINAINSLSLLSHLTLAYEAILLCNENCNIMPIQLENLQEFNCINDYYFKDTCKAILRYAQSHPNLRVGFDLQLIRTEDTELLFSYDHQVASRITQLCLYNVATEPLLTRVCGHFTNLTTLQLANGNLLSVPKWTRAIAQCSKLVHLRLNLFLNRYSQDIREIFTKKEITQLKSIKMLSIALSSNSHLDLKILKFKWIFPNLEMIYINVTNLSCYICGKEDCYCVNYVISNKRRYIKCLKHLLSPLKTFKQLKVIKYYSANSGNVFCSKEDL